MLTTRKPPWLPYLPKQYAWKLYSACSYSTHSFRSAIFCQIHLGGVSSQATILDFTPCALVNITPLASVVANTAGVERQAANARTGQACAPVNVQDIVRCHISHAPTVRPACIPICVVRRVGGWLCRVVVKLAINHPSTSVEMASKVNEMITIKPTDCSIALQCAVSQMSGDDSQAVELCMRVS